MIILAAINKLKSKSTCVHTQLKPLGILNGNKLWTFDEEKEENRNNLRNRVEICESKITFIESCGAKKDTASVTKRGAVIMWPNFQRTCTHDNQLRCSAHLISHFAYFAIPSPAHRLVFLLFGAAAVVRLFVQGCCFRNYLQTITIERKKQQQQPATSEKVKFFNFNLFFCLHENNDLSSTSYDFCSPMDKWISSYV